MAAVLAEKELLVGSDYWHHTLTKGSIESSFRFFLLNQVNRLPAGKGILEQFLFSACEARERARERENSQEFSACEDTPERLCICSPLSLIPVSLVVVSFSLGTGMGNRVYIFIWLSDTTYLLAGMQVPNLRARAPQRGAAWAT